MRLDSGGIAKGLFGDLLAAALYGHAAFAVDAAGDIRFGGADGLPRPVQVASPLDDSTCGPSSTACGFTPSGISHLLAPTRSANRWRRERGLIQTVHGVGYVLREL